MLNEKGNVMWTKVKINCKSKRDFGDRLQNVDGDWSQVEWLLSGGCQLWL